MAANYKNNKKNREVTIIQGVRLLVQGSLFLCSLKNIFAFYKRARSARHGCIDVLPLILQEFLFILGHESCTKHILPDHGLYGFLEGHYHCVMRKAQKYYLLLISRITTKKKA